MRTVSGTITTAEVGPALAPTHSVVVQNELLSFASPTTQSNGSLDTAIPQTFRMLASGTSAYAAYRFTTGTHYLRAVDTGTAGDFQLSSTNAVTIGSSGTMYAMRSGFSIESGTQYIYTAYPDTSQIRVRRASLSGSSNPLTATFGNYNSLFGPALTDTATFIRRVEAVCPTDAGGVIVAMGEHSFTNQRSTITFYWLPSSGATIIRLNTIIQMSLTESYTNWYSAARYCTNISAVSDSSGNICVVANAQPNSGTTRGRAVYFTVKNGIESELRPVMPTDSEQTTAFFMPASLTTINSLHYLTGRMTRINTDDSTVSYDCYLISSDFKSWSLGERSHYIGTAAAAGTLLHPTSGATLYYAGNLYHTSASTTPVQYAGASGQILTLDSDVASWSVQQITDGADTIGATFSNEAGALTGSSILKRGAVLYLDTGQEGTNADFGVYGIDKIDESVGLTGRSAMTVSGRDIAGKRLADWKCPIDLWLESSARKSSTLESLDGITRKTNESGYSLTTEGLVYDGLNDPLIAYVDAPHEDNTLIKATATFDIANDYHVSTLGFVFGAGEDGEGNVVLLPKVHSWTNNNVTTPIARRLDLPSVDPDDPDADNSGFNLITRRNNMIIQPSGGGQVRTLAALGGTTNTASTYGVPVGTATDVAFRTAGRRVQLWTKTRNYAPSTTAANAGWTLRYEYLYDYQTQMRRTGKNCAGLTLCTDVYADISAFAQSAYDDIEQTLTDANNTNSAPGDYNTNSWAVTTQSGNVNLNGSTPPTWLVVGEWIRVNIPSYTSSHMAQVTNISSNNITITPSYDIGIPPGTNATVLTIDAADEWGYASCGKKNLRATEADELGDLAVYLDPGAMKRPRAIYGRALFVTDDGTAAAARYVVGDGVRFSLRSGSPSTKIAWDATNPTPEPPAGSTSYITTRWGGSDPARWRIIFHHGFMFSGSPSTYGLPTSGYMKVEDEVMRYEAQSFYRRGYLTQTTWTVVPAYYAPLAAATGPTSTLRNWRSTGGAQPGDDLGTISGAAGMLVEVSSRANGPIQNDKQYYVASATYVGSPSVGSTSYITLDIPYEHSIAAANTDTSTLPEANTYGDIAILSGRGQFASLKTAHEPDTPVVYYPCDSAGTQASITLTNLDYTSGTHTSAEDAIRRICALAGQRSVTFRNAFSSSYTTASYSFTGGTSATALPLAENLSNFCMEMSARVVTGARLYIDFRSYYRLSIRHVATGNFQVGILTTSTDISADGSGDRWLEYVNIPMTDYDFSASGANCDVRVIAIDNYIQVECNGQLAWTFNLDHFNDGASNNYKQTGTGPIEVLYSTSIGANTITARVMELGEPMTGIAIRKTQTARGGIDSITQDRRIKSRTTATGGIEFGQHRVRDNAGTLQYNLVKDSWTLDDGRNAGHIQVTGEEVTGDALDDTTLRTEGYKFDSASGNLAATTSECLIEARLWLRDQQESQEGRTVDGYGRIALQPEDRVALVYAPGGDTPAHSSSDHVLNSITLKADNQSVKGTYSIRRYVSSL